MKTRKKGTPSSRAARRRRVAHKAEGVASGALVGAVVGSAAGSPGAVAGAIIGGVAGGLAGAVIDQESSAAARRTRELDAEIGVTGGDLGAPNLKHPPPKSGSYSAASSGAGPSSAPGAEGPISTPP